MGRSRSRSRERTKKSKKHKSRRSRSRSKERKRDRKERKRDRNRSRSRSPRKEKYDPIVIRSRSNSPDIKPDIRHRPAEVPERRVTITKKPAEPDVQVVEPDKSAYSRLFQKSKELEKERRRMKEVAERAKAEKEKLLAPVANEEINEEEMMMQMMGFAGFETTANKQVLGNDVNGESRCQKQRKYRQYMNRKGGFNRPLDSM